MSPAEKLLVITTTGRSRVVCGRPPNSPLTSTYTLAPCRTSAPGSTSKSAERICAISEATKNGVAVPPSTCISSKDSPSGPSTRSTAGAARGGPQPIAKQPPRGLATVCGNRPHVPDHRLLFIQVGRRYEQHLAARSLSGNGLDEPAAHQVVDQLYERLAPIGAGSKQHAKPARLQETGGPVGAQGFDHSLVPLRAQASKRGDQRADADSRDDLELRTISAAREADERAATDRASGPAARERKNVECLAVSRLAEAAQRLSRMGQHEAAVQAEEAHGLWES